MKNNISVVISTYNEEKNIAACLESVDWADEIIVVDDGSNDKTVQIAKKYKSKIYFHRSQGYVEPMRNFAVSKSSNEWILVLDADERVPKRLAQKLQEIAQTKNSEYVYVKIPRKNIIFNKWIAHTGWWPDYNIRFFKRGSLNFSSVIHSDPSVKGEEILLEPDEELALYHENYTSIMQYFSKLQRYTKFQADALRKNGYTFHWKDIIVKASSEFLTRFFYQKGYKDGFHGFILSLLQAFSEIVVYLQVWEAQGFKEYTKRNFLQELRDEMRNQRKQFTYWYFTERIEGTKNVVKKYYLKLLRRINT